jgi:hypothetical protein
LVMGRFVMGCFVCESGRSRSRINIFALSRSRIKMMRLGNTGLN